MWKILHNTVTNEYNLRMSWCLERSIEIRVFCGTYKECRKWLEENVKATQVGTSA